ncbi:MAG: DNA repair protein RadA [Bacteroidales bacterium]|nr:DNA repair protein RadA [Bacteroidales bacterium]
MAKLKTIFHCRECGASSPKWLGKCPTCGAWNTFEEEVVAAPKAGGRSANGGLTPSRADVPQARPLVEITGQGPERLPLGDDELDRVLGGGLVRGSLLLVGGEPGIGKSTLMLQVALQLDTYKVLYVSGEESEQQLKMRADRIGLSTAPCFILTETCVERILEQAGALQPDIVVIDSIQTLYSEEIESSAGSIVQIRECAARLQQFAKTRRISVFMIGHITKEGSLAGPKVLEHIVDTVLQFEGDRHYDYRILRSLKNRFGSTHEMGIYEMQAQGLRQVSNPSEILLSKRETLLSGTAIAATMEGLRPILIEVQALVGGATYSVPQRSATGFDLRRLHMLLAVLEKRCGFRLTQKDVFLNIAGGIRVEDPAIDLAVVAAVLSSGTDIALSPKDCFAGEVGLTGEIRSVSRIEQRIAEAERLGFERIFISRYHRLARPAAEMKIKAVQVANLFELFRNVLPKEAANRENDAPQE